MEEDNICEDNRFEIIEKAKEILLNTTNIENSKEEMKVLTNILFRIWQAGLINEKKLDINKLQKENSIEEDIVKKFEEFCEDLYIFKDDDMGGHFEGVVGDQIANTKLGYLIFKEKLEDFLSEYKRVLKENEKKNKIIDLMANKLALYCEINCEEDIKTNKEQIRRYFENKAST